MLIISSVGEGMGKQKFYAIAGSLSCCNIFGGQFYNSCQKNIEANLT